MLLFYVCWVSVAERGGFINPVYLFLEYAKAFSFKKTSNNQTRLNNKKGRGRKTFTLPKFMVIAMKICYSIIF